MSTKDSADAVRQVLRFGKYYAYGWVGTDLCFSQVACNKQVCTKSIVNLSDIFFYCLLVVGEKRCPIVDTWWQTETGSIAISGLPGAFAMKRGCASLPFFGIQPVLMDDKVIMWLTVTNVP